MISIIVPVYNLEVYIQHTLESLFAQTYREIEVIAVDDGSTDGSAKILDEYAAKEPRLHVIHKINEGVSAARNAGLAIANGEYIGFCDGDDEVEPEMYERLLANLLKYDADISHCGMLTIGLDGQTRYFHNTCVLEVHSHEEGILEILKGEKVEPSLCMKIYRKELFKELKFDTKILFNEDLLINFYLFQRAECSVFEDVCLYHYIRREGSACKSDVAEKHVFHPVEVRRRILEQCSGESQVVQDVAMANYLHANMSAYGLVLENRARKFRKFKSVFRKNLLQSRDKIGLLNRTGRLHAWLILYLPFLCSTIFTCYYKLFSKKRYG